MLDSLEVKNPNLCNIVKSSVSGGLLVTLLCTPSDVIKNYWYYNKSLDETRTRMSSFDVIRHLYHKKGIKSFWTGVNWSLSITISGQIIFFYTYDNLKNQTNSPTASILSRLLSLMLIQPLDYMRTYTQANLSNIALSSFSNIAKTSGIISLYRGLYPTLIRDIPFSAMHWPVNELFYNNIKKRLYTDRKMTSMELILIPFITGSLSSTIATVISQPFDIIKTNIQAAMFHEDGLSLRNEYRRIMSTYGVKGFFVGLSPRLFKVVPGSAIMATAYRYFNV